MTTRARRSQVVKAQSADEGVVEEGAERYIWVFREGNQLVLAIPGLRGLKFSVQEARAMGEMLIQAADEMTENHRGDGTEDQGKLGEGGDGDGGSEEPSVEG
jgi:hypothetical protein